MRFHQPVGVVPPNNEYISVSLCPDSRFLINSRTNNQLTRINGNNFANVTESLNLTQLQSIVTAKQSESINNFDSTLDVNKTTTLDEILKFKNDSKYFKSYFGGQQTDTSNIDLENGNDGVIFIETLNFTADNLSEVREREALASRAYEELFHARTTSKSFRTTPTPRRQLNLFSLL